MPSKRLPEELLRDAECSKVVAGAESQLSDDDREIWIISVPRDIDIATMNGATIAMEGIEQTLPGDKKYHVAISQAPIISSRVVIPTPTAGELEYGPKICGELQFMQRVDVGKVEVPEAVTGSDKVPFPAGLKQRWKPFGWKTPYLRPKSHKKRSKQKKTKIKDSSN